MGNPNGTIALLCISDNINMKDSMQSRVKIHYLSTRIGLYKYKEGYGICNSNRFTTINKAGNFHD